MAPDTTGCTACGHTEHRYWDGCRRDGCNCAYRPTETAPNDGQDRITTTAAPDAGMAALTRLLDRQERDRLAVRAAHYANDARNIVARVALYEDVHPDDAPCLESLLRAVPDIAWRGHDTT